MPIAKMNGGAPKVEVQSDGWVGLYAVDDTNPSDPIHGFLFDRATTLAVGLRLIAALQDGPPETRPMLELQSFEGGVVHQDGAKYARLEFTVQGAKLPVFLDRKQLSQLVAMLADTSARL